GEQHAEREAGKTLQIVGRQLDGSLPDGATAANLVIAYEPVWAIGTGLTQTAAHVAQVHAFIRDRLNKRFTSQTGAVRIVYGGSGQTHTPQHTFTPPKLDGEHCAGGQ